MDKERAAQIAHRRHWLRARGVGFWATVITVTAVCLLWVGSQVAVWAGQDVDWYTGFGQWLGALGSLIAAGVALWIAVSDRWHRERQQDADLVREAGLVRVTAERLNMWQPVGPSTSAAAVGVKNYRKDRIFEVRVSRFIFASKEIQPQISDIDVSPREANRRMLANELRHLVLAPDQLLALFPTGLPDIPAEYAAVDYTDSSGRRWRVDTAGAVQRLT